MQNLVGIDSTATGLRMRENRGGGYRGDGGTRPPTFWLGDAKVNVPH